MMLVVTFGNGIVKKFDKAVRWTVKEGKCDSFIVRNENDQIIFMSHWSDVLFLELQEEANDAAKEIFDKYN